MSAEAIPLPAAVPALPSNYGDRFVLAVREYLHTNGLRTLGQINAKILAEIAQRFQDNQVRVKKQKVRLASEEEWLKGIEADPAMLGIDVRKELGKCQFWCKTNSKVATRARFANWLLNPQCEKKINFTYDGASSRPKPIAAAKPAASVEQPVPGWPLILRNQVDGYAEDKVDAFCAADWHELPKQVRETIIKFA